MEWSQMLFRWIHVVAGIAWIGHLYFFNFVNAQVAKSYDADSKKKVVPELMPRALYWFRWGAAYTWLTGFLLAGMVYYMGGGLVDSGKPLSQGAAIGVSLALILFGFFIYDALWKALAKNETAGVALSSVLVLILIFALYRLFVPRAAAIHVGAIFGTIMAMNVWMRIWPAQRKILAGIAGTGPAADPALVAMAGLRSKHNTYMSVPLVISMLSQHHLTIFGGQPGFPGWAAMVLVVALGWGATKLLYMKSAGPAPKQF